MRDTINPHQRVLVEVGLNTYKMGTVTLTTTSWIRVVLDDEKPVAHDWRPEQVRPMHELAEAPTQAFFGKVA